MSTLFVYGTLCLPEVRNVLLRRSVPAASATLHGHRVARVDGHTYPTLVPDATAGLVHGYVLGELGPAEQRVLRQFEPPVYDLIEVTVGLTDASGAVSTLTYRHRDAVAVAREPWSPAAFVGTARTAFLAEVADAAAALWEDEPFSLRASTS